MRNDYKELLSRIDSLTQRMEMTNLEIRDLKEQNSVLKDEFYTSSKSRKGIEKNRCTKGKNYDNDNPFPKSSLTNAVGFVNPEKKESATVYHGPSRKGTTYNKSVVGEPIVQKCALAKLPLGIVVFKEKDFLGDSKIKSLQSESYSVYMFLDDELIEEHLLLSGSCT